jgi:predicted ATPase
MAEILIKRIEVVEEMKPLKPGLTIDIKESILILVGDNGVGKSTITDGLASMYGKKDDTYLKRNEYRFLNIETTRPDFKTKFIDFHGDDRKFAGSFGGDVSLQMFHMKASSGQVSLSLLSSAGLKEFKDGLLVLDEPDRGLSLRNQLGMVEILLMLPLIKNVQIIMTCHSDIILKGLSKFAQFYDVGKMKDVTYQEYFNSQTDGK